ncbi:hypothetical protein CEXT_585451 [Caerostris extrusa]|uniref:Uncharacterized protein n=1 Tax=Caerostris extrusa TaxID=172846 RepID=A0AAV4PGI0_CAEEX|nr:hypothetical protein CEXT_585451 [Caerostris extrusa]
MPIPRLDLRMLLPDGGRFELCPLPSCKKHKINNFNSQIKRNAAHLHNHEHDNDSFTMPSKKLIAKVNYAKNPHHLVESKIALKTQCRRTGRARP